MKKHETKNSALSCQHIFHQFSLTSRDASESDRRNWRNIKVNCICRRKCQIVDFKSSAQWETNKTWWIHQQILLSKSGNDEKGMPMNGVHTGLSSRFSCQIKINKPLLKIIISSTITKAMVKSKSVWLSLRARKPPGFSILPLFQLATVVIVCFIKMLKIIIISLWRSETKKLNAIIYWNKEDV